VATQSSNQALQPLCDRQVSTWAFQWFRNGLAPDASPEEIRADQSSLSKGEDHLFLTNRSMMCSHPGDVDSLNATAGKRRAFSIRNTGRNCGKFNVEIADAVLVARLAFSKRARRNGKP
jgi:hypothetical protein